jgi:hypothetical protein
MNNLLKTFNNFLTKLILNESILIMKRLFYFIKVKISAIHQNKIWNIINKILSNN